MKLHKDSALKYDELDQRREIFRLMGFPGFDEKKRLAFMEWCRRRSGPYPPDRIGPADPKQSYGWYEAVMDMTMLTLQYSLDIDVALAELSRRVRKL